MSDFFGFGAGTGSTRFARNIGRSLSGTSIGTIRYPSPFFDIAHTYLPPTFRSMLKWCRYYFITNPLINAVVYKMAEYPVTDLIFDTTKTALKKKWRMFFNKILKFKKFRVEAGLDYNTFGNCFISIHFPFVKLLTCKQCGYAVPVDKQKYTFRSYEFHGECQKCGYVGEFKAKDFFIQSVRDIRLIRWNPEQIHIQHNESTGESLYYYTPPGTLRNDLQLGKKHIVERTPQAFIDAVRQNRSLLFNKNNLFHLKRPTIAQKDRGWGLPIILPVLKDTFYLQVLRKAQEAIAVEHVVPLRVLFPQMNSGTSDPYATINITTWKDKVEQEILRWRLDNNYIPVLPIPIGQQTLGGDGRALLLSQEYRAEAEWIVAGMHVPNEFVFGGMQYSGSNVSLRMLENHFLDQNTEHSELVDWVMENVGPYLGWEVINHHFRRFKMADDLQRSAFNLQLNQAGKLSDQSLMEETDWDSVFESDRIMEEQQRMLTNQRKQAIAQAAIQGEAQLVMQKYQFRSQRALEANLPQQPGTGGPLEQPPSMMPTGVPGQVSPDAQAQQGLVQQQAQIQAGQTPPVDNAAMMQQMYPQGIPQEMQSPIGLENVTNTNPGQPEAVQMDIHEIAQKIAAWLDQKPDHEKVTHLEEVKAQSPQLYQLVAQQLQERAGAHQSSAGAPLPNQRPPRRGPEAATS